MDQGNTGDGDLFGEEARSVELLWGERAGPSRGPKPGLTLAAITAAAIEIADTEGPAALSMQRVAKTFGFTTMALYRYVPGKRELVALMVDTAIGPPPDLAAVPGGWRPRLAEWAMRFWAALVRHPWATRSTAGHRALGPNELGWMDAGLRALEGTGLTGAERLDTLALVTSYVRGMAQQTVTVAGGPAGTDEHAMAKMIAGLVHRYGDRHPAVTAALAEAAAVPEAQETGLRYGLDRILDGLARLIDSRRHPERS
ncbi:TetR family transcriptional regulator [Sphaerisporangium rufum]|uniref:TetR family transcriptional regulator n=1 Tax=Sphaerisporangium rufum TaxID=1381558 RepID=A0A919R219_9ACTN|nr:TetR/AcrR family transcriptional regulator C-terminal domain-containing protein [Sphaerisporangium rufum]GII75635.1 TetR family transcriptional regulator [Sphaerisporangium rufum]